MKKVDAPIAVCSRTFSKHETLRRETLEHFSNVKFNDAGKSLSGDSLVEFMKGSVGAIVALEKVTEDVLSKLPDLRLISKYGVGLDNLDFQAMERRGVKLGWTGGVNARSVSELALGFMLSILRAIPTHTRAMRGGTWKQEKSWTLSGRTIGIIGVGHIGKDLIRLLKPFEVKILANDVLDVSAFCEEVGAEVADLNQVLRDSDIVSLHIPYEKNTHHFLGAPQFSRMKPGAILINTSRGNIVDEVALHSALGSGQILGAGFDVFAVEPVGSSNLFSHERFYSTPHVGGSSEEAILAMGRAAIQNLLHLFG